MNKAQTFSRAVRRGLYAATLAGLVAPVAIAAAPVFATAAHAQQEAQTTLSAEMRATLAQYGNFVQHATYGEVWVPAVTPTGWHPYPACNWVQTQQFGWFFDDKTPWGQIVHHYGRWTNDTALGWIWTPGAEFSPGWVVWRTSAEWTGWAPMPPEADVGKVSSDEFNVGSQWTFIETQKMRSGCTQQAVVPGPQIPLVMRETRFVTDIAFVDGVAVFVLPKWVWLPFVHINIGFAPWSPWFLSKSVFAWNWVWSNLNITVNIVNACKK